MVKYFHDILGTRTLDSIEFINLTKSVSIQDLFTDVHTEKYLIQDGDTLDTIAYDLYGSVDYWWVIALCADIHDPFNGLPMSSESLRSYYSWLVERGDISDTPAEWTALKTWNNAKREIQVLKEKYLQDLIFIIEETLRGE